MQKNGFSSDADVQRVQSIKFLDAAQPTRFGPDRVPPYLYLIVDREDWRSNMQRYLPPGKTPAEGVPLCDIDRLDSLAARKYFMFEYKQKLKQDEEGGFLSSLSKPFVRAFTGFVETMEQLPQITAKWLRSPTKADHQSLAPASARVSGKHTSLYEKGAHIVNSPTHALIVLKTDILQQNGDILWDGEHKYPRLRRPLLHVGDVWAAFPLSFDLQKSIVPLPSEGQMSTSFSQTTKVLAAVDNS